MRHRRAQAVARAAAASWRRAGLLARPRWRARRSRRSPRRRSRPARGSGGPAGSGCPPPRRGSRRGRRACRRPAGTRGRASRRSGSSAVSRRSQSEPIFTWVTSSASIQSSQNSSTGSPAIVAELPHGVEHVDGEALEGAVHAGEAQHRVGVAGRLVEEGVLGELADLGAHPVAELDGDLAVAGLVPALAGHVELELERRLVAAVAGRRSPSRCARRPRGPGSRPRRCRASGPGRRRARPGRSGVSRAWARLPAVLDRAGVVDAVLDRRPGRSARPGPDPRRGRTSSCRRPPRLWLSVGVADGARAGDAAGGQHQLLQLGPWWRRPARPRRRSRSATGSASRRRASPRTRPAGRT